MLLDSVRSLKIGVMECASDLGVNIAPDDADYLSVLKAAAGYISQNRLGLPEEPQTHQTGLSPWCVTLPLFELYLTVDGVTSIVVATGYSRDFGWIKVNVFDRKGRPVHQRDVSDVPELHFLGLPWLSRRASAFIWAVWHDADSLAGHIAAHR